MQKSQRYGLLLLAVICIAIIVTLIVRSRLAYKRFGYDMPHPTEFTVLSTEFVDTTQYVSSESISKKKGDGKKSKEKKIKDSSQKPVKPAPRKDWLDEP